MFRSASLFIDTSFIVAVFTIFATSNVDSIVGIPHKIYLMQRILIHIKSRSLCQMCPSASRVCSEPDGQKQVLSSSLDHTKISLKCIPMGPIGNTSTLVQVMVWWTADHKPLPETVFTKVYDAIPGGDPTKVDPNVATFAWMPAECQTVQMCLPLTTLALPWHCADFNCLFSGSWWRHRECSHPRDTKSESKIPSTLLTPLLWCGLLRRLSMLTFWSTMEVLPFHVCRATSHSVNACISSVIVLPIIVSVWMIFNYHRYDFHQWIMRLWVNAARQMWRHLNVATFEYGDICGNRH